MKIFIKVRDPTNYIFYHYEIMENTSKLPYSDTRNPKVKQEKKLDKRKTLNQKCKKLF